jgi:hypothetical protein
MATTQEVDPFLKATLPTCVLSRRGLSLYQHAPRSSPYDTGAGSHATCKLAQDRRSQTAARGACNPAVTSIPPLSPRPVGERADRHAGGMQLHQGGTPFQLRRIQHGGPGPHVMWPARRLLHAKNCTATRASAAHPRPRNRCHDSRQPCAWPNSANQTCRSRVSQPWEKARWSIWPEVPAAGGWKQQSNCLQAHVLSWNSERALSHGVKTTRPCSVPRTARACTTTAPRTTRPVALTLRQGRRHLWQAKRATLHLRHNTTSKKVRHDIQFHILFRFPFLSLANRDRERGYSKRDPSPRRKRAPSPLLIRGSKAGPPEGFDSRLRALGLRAHNWSEVRRLAPRKGSTAASGHSGSAPTTDQGFEGWPPEGFDSRLRTRRVRDGYGYVRYITKARATLPRYPRTFPRPAGAIL